jgi:hypothetical protein
VASIIIPGETATQRVVRHEADGNQALTVVERLGTELSDNPKDFPTLTAAHLMGGDADPASDTRVSREIDAVLSRSLRAKAVGAGLFKVLRDKSPILLYDTYLLGRVGFVKLLQATMRPDSLASGLSQAELEQAWEVFELNMQQLAAAGARLRKRKDWR